MSIRELCQKHKDVIAYAFFGVCTTLVNVIVYWVIAHPFNMSVLLSTMLAWVIAVLFAYFTNRKWVFNSTANGFAEISREIVGFFACRLVTGILDWACMYVFVERLGFNDVVIKFLANVLVIILNYIASKLLIFKKRR